MQNFPVSKPTAMVFALALAVIVTTTAVFAVDADDTTTNYGPGYMMGPGMMGGYGPGYGMMGGYGGYGMGPGMMGGYGGYGMGPGMMGGYGMGPSMMGGYGGYGMGFGMMGPGMMGMMGPGMMGMMGPGMMGYGGLYGLDLSDAQRAKINKILDDQRKQHWGVMGGMMDAWSRMRDLYDADQPDPKKIGAVYGDIAKMQRQLIESQVQAQNQLRNVLTKEQREQLRDWTRGGWGWGSRGSAGGGTTGPGMMRR